MCQVTDGFHSVPQSSYLIFMQDEDSFAIVKVVSVSADVGWVVIPYYYYDFKQTRLPKSCYLLPFKGPLPPPLRNIASKW